MKAFMRVDVGLAFSAAAVSLHQLRRRLMAGLASRADPLRSQAMQQQRNSNTDPIDFTGNDITMYVQGGANSCMVVGMSVAASRMYAFGTPFLTDGQFVVGPDLTSAQMRDVPVAMTEYDHDSNPVATFPLVISTTFTGTGILTRSHFTNVSNSTGVHVSQDMTVSQSHPRPLDGPSDRGGP